MTNRTNSTQTERVLNALVQGKTLTANQIANKFGAGNPHEVIRKLREAGNPIYTNLVNGLANYRLGTARKQHIRTAYARRGANAFR
jgi:hypothetical protein